MLKDTSSSMTALERLLTSPFLISTPRGRFAGPAWLALALVATICLVRPFS